MSNMFRKLLLVYLPLALLGLIAVGLVMAVLSGAMFLAYSGILLGPLAGFAIAHAVKRTRYRRDLAALGYVEQSVRLNLPLTRMLPAIAASERGALATNIRRIESDIESGMNLSDALHAHLRSLPPEVHAAITTGEMSGCLNRQLTRVIEQQRQEVRRQQSKEPLAIIYPLLVLISLICTLGAVSTFILPKYEKIYEDFETTLPALTLFIFDLGRTTGPILLLLGALSLIVVCVWTMATLANLNLLAIFHTSLFRRLAWYLPLLHGIERDRGLATLFDLLSDAIEAGHTIPAALGMADSLDLNPVLEGRVLRWRHGVEAGVALDEAAEKAGMPAVAVSMLRTGQTTTRLPDVFRFLSRYHHSRFSQVADAIRATTLPLIIVLLAVVVGFFTVAVFMPLPELIESVSNSAL